MDVPTDGRTFRPLMLLGQLGGVNQKKNETLHIRVHHGKLLQRVQYRSHRRRRSSWMRRVLGQKVCCQLVTTPSDTTVNSSHDFRVWRVDHVVPKSQHCPLVFFLKFISGVSYKGWYAIRSSISYQVPWMAVDFNAILQKTVAFVFSGHHTDEKCPVVAENGV